MKNYDIINKVLLNRFFLKDGGFSKTSVILCITWVFVLFKYLFSYCIVNFMIFGVQIYYPIVFSWTDAAAITGSASSLYFAIHNINPRPKEEYKERNECR